MQRASRTWSHRPAAVARGASELSAAVIVPKRFLKHFVRVLAKDWRLTKDFSGSPPTDDKDFADHLVLAMTLHRSHGTEHAFDTDASSERLEAIATISVKHVERSGQVYGRLRSQRDPRRPRPRLRLRA